MLVIFLKIILITAFWRLGFLRFYLQFKLPLIFENLFKLTIRRLKHHYCRRSLSLPTSFIYWVKRREMSPPAASSRHLTPLGLWETGGFEGVLLVGFDRSVSKWESYLWSSTQKTGTLMRSLLSLRVHVFSKDAAKAMGERLEPQVSVRQI